MVNYDNLGKEQILKLEDKPTLLLHSCCGPCSSYVISYLKDFFDITILYYNPNIEPKEEYLKRKEEQIKLINLMDCNIKLYDIDYENELYHDKVVGYENEKEGGYRCHLCYELRLEKTALIASQNNFAYFCTTLTVSPYKNAQVINELGESLAKKYNLNWLYSDFKKRDGYKKSILLSKEYNLYRQNYCGCLFSKNMSIKEN